MKKEYAKEYAKETLISIAKGGFGAVPNVGTALNEVFFDLRSRVKQNRLNHFVNELSVYMEEVSEDNINPEYIKSDKFGDIFESIIRHVINTGSEEKLHRFKKILVKEMISESNSNFIETFLDIISKINDKQIEILNEHRKLLNASERVKNSSISEVRDASHYDLSDNEYVFYVQDLISKGLLIDDGMIRLNEKPLNILKITQFGVGLLEFIEEQ